MDGDAVTSGDEPPTDDEAISAAHPETPESEPVPHSALVGFMSVRVHRWLPIRRSTLLMVVAFLGFGAWTLLYPPYSAPNGGSPGTTIFPGIVPPATTTTTTTTTVPASTTTTTPGSSTTSTGTPKSSTTTTRPPSTSTTTTVHSTQFSTTTVPSATTSSTSGSSSATAPTGG